jgi:hypothetical protein
MFSGSLAVFNIDESSRTIALGYGFFMAYP